MMSSSHRPPSSTIFIGNIPYDVTEQMLMDIFQEVGPVKSLRLVSDRDTGKPKGYGFCEYYEVQVAESAMHNLNGREVNGRSLRVDYADEHQAARERRGDRAPEPQQRASQYLPPPPQAPGSKIVGPQAAQVASQQMDMLLGGPGASQEKVSAIIAGMTPKQLYELMAQFKLLLHSNHQGTRDFLVSKPQVVKALFQAQIVLGMVKAPPPPQPNPSPQPQGAPAASQAPVAAPQQQPPSQAQPGPMYPPQQGLPPNMGPQQPPQMMAPMSQPQGFPPGAPGYAPMGMPPMGNMPPGMGPPGMMPPPGAGPPGYMEPQQMPYQPGLQGGPPMQQMPGMPPPPMMSFPPGMQLAPQPGGPGVPMQPQPNQPPPMMLAPQQQPPGPPQQQMPPMQQQQQPPPMQGMVPGPMPMAPQPGPQEQQGPPMQPQQQQAPPAAQPANLDPGQQALLLQVMQMSEAQLAALPEPTRTQVLQLKERAKGLFPQGPPAT